MGVLVAVEGSQVVALELVALRPGSRQRLGAQMKAVFLTIVAPVSAVEVERHRILPQQQGTR